ncbi:traB domain-containing protein [Condylostylus longicornis]|uniref:traB domain-containing protein n=1 Tax=Condylostylus longicornis TaxID=2530218 RepID=UPI00244DD212|nr:traB domain-containing protein [Condylostylus longicornis]
MDSPLPTEDISLYNSALENFTLSSIDTEEYTNNNTTNGLTTDFADLTLNGNDDDNTMDLNTSSTTNSLQLSDSSDCLEVDPKSQLANKTIFKTDNPNLSIIEISDTSTKEEENSVYLIESDGDDEHIKKVNALLHSSKQKLNISSENSNSSKKSEIKATNSSNVGPKLVKQKNIEEITRNPASQRQIKIYETIEEFEKNLPQTVTVLTTQCGSKVYLVGTAHFSEESQDDVSFVIRNVRPDIVMVELCPSRIHILKHDEKTLLEEAKNFNMATIRSIINTNGVVNGIFFILLLHMSAQLAKELGMAPGGEFRRAFDEVVKIPGCMLHLGDRPINITLQRALRALSLWQTIKLVWRLTSTENISIEEVEECKQRDLLEKLMQEMAGEFPAFSDVFVKERDLYLCHSLQVAASPQLTNGVPRPVKVVGVVGIGHAAGIARNWEQVDPNAIPDILKIPPAKLSTRIFKYTIKYGFICCFAYGIYKFARPKLVKYF